MSFINNIRLLNFSANLSNMSKFLSRFSSEVLVYEYLLLCRLMNNFTDGLFVDLINIVSSHFDVIS